MAKMGSSSNRGVRGERQLGAFGGNLVIASFLVARSGLAFLVEAAAFLRGGLHLPHLLYDRLQLAALHRCLVASHGVRLGGVTGWNAVDGAA
jgi:hypothetical protein